MNIDSLLRDGMFFVSEALIGMRRSGIMILISIATISVSLIVFGIFLLISMNINNLTNFISSKLEIRVYLKKDLPASDMNEFRQRILAMNHVKDVVYVDKATAWVQFKENFKTIDLADMVNDNPLPDSFHVYLTDNQDIGAFSKYLGGFTQYVEEVGYMGAIADRIALFSRFTKIAGAVLVALLTVATLLITVNTIRLTVIARQNEITIMHLVGATHQFIQWPFIIEGLIMGLIGSVISIFFLKSSYFFFATRFQKTLPYFPLVFDSWNLNLVFLGVALLGTTLGILGAYISVSKSLKATL